MWDRYKLNRPGLDAILGSLERQIMAVVWALGEATVTDVHDRIETQNSYDTVKTVMSRLTERSAVSGP